MQILIGTHAIIEIKFSLKTSGFAVVDEQHKFGVAQGQLWKKNSLPPYILVRRRPPIPRTLALTAYGDLDYSVINELPPGPKANHYLSQNRTCQATGHDFIRQQIALGRQAYIIYPLIEREQQTGL